MVIQTRSGLVCRDLDILKEFKDIEAGFSITTANDEIRKIFEPCAPSIEKRLKAIETLHQNGIRTYAMIAPILPEAENLIRMLAGKVDYTIIHRMNYFHAVRIYERHGWRDKSTYEYFEAIGNKIVKDCTKLQIECRSVYPMMLFLIDRSRGWDRWRTQPDVAGPQWLIISLFLRMLLTTILAPD